MKEKIIKRFDEEFNWLFGGKIILFTGIIGQEERLNVNLTKETFKNFISQALDEYREWSINDCLPKKADNSARKFCDKEFIAGYNACIDQILSNKDKK